MSCMPAFYTILFSQPALYQCAACENQDDGDNRVQELMGMGCVPSTGIAIGNAAQGDEGKL